MTMTANATKPSTPAAAKALSEIVMARINLGMVVSMRFRSRHSRLAGAWNVNRLNDLGRVVTGIYDPLQRSLRRGAGYPQSGLSRRAVRGISRR